MLTGRAPLCRKCVQAVQQRAAWDLYIALLCIAAQDVAREASTQAPDQARPAPFERRWTKVHSPVAGGPPSIQSSGMTSATKRIGDADDGFACQRFRRGNVQRRLTAVPVAVPADAPLASRQPTRPDPLRKPRAIARRVARPEVFAARHRVAARAVPV